MNLRPSLAFAAGSLLALFSHVSPAAAQSAPPAGSPGGAPPGGTWGAGLPGAPAPYPGTAPGYGPGAAPGATPQLPPPQGAYPQGAYPPGAYPQGAYPPGAMPPPGNGPWSSPNGEPTMLGADGRLHSLPLEMPYDADKGIPPGYRVAEKPRYSLAIAGGATLGGLWILSCIVGGAIEDGGQYSGNHGWPMYIPVVGPWITIATSHSGGSGTVSLLFDGAFQAAGAVMFLVGLNTSTKVLKYQFQGGEMAFHPVIAPTQGGGFAGLTASF